MQRLLKSGTLGAVLPDGGKTRQYVSYNDSLGRRRLGSQRNIPRRRQG
jgi:hypothetical protein